MIVDSSGLALGISKLMLATHLAYSLLTTVFVQSASSLNSFDWVLEIPATLLSMGSQATSGLNVVSVASSSVTCESS